MSKVEIIIILYSILIEKKLQDKEAKYLQLKYNLDKDS